MRLVKLSTKHFPNEGDLDDYFDNKLDGRWRFYFGNQIREDGIVPNETILFSYQKQLRYVAKAKTSILTDNDRGEGKYRHFFVIKARIRKVNVSVENLDQQLRHRAGFKKSLRFQAWTEIQDQRAEEVIKDLLSTYDVSDRWCSALTKQGAFDHKNENDARERIERTIVLRRGQQAFRQKLLSLYGGKCILTGCDAEQVLEAVHILPYKGIHTNHPSNGLLLRADLHTLFDLRLISIDTSNMSILVAPSLKNTSYGKLLGKNLRIPRGCPNPPSTVALAKHRKKSGL